MDRVVEWWRGATPSGKPVRFIKPTKYNQYNIYRRKDGLYALDLVLCHADLDMISTEQAEDAICYNLAWLNPLKWVTVAVNKDKEELRKLAKEIALSGSCSTTLAKTAIVLSSIDWRIDGVSGSTTVETGAMEVGTNLEMMAHSI